MPMMPPLGNPVPPLLPLFFSLYDWLALSSELSLLGSVIVAAPCSLPVLIAYETIKSKFQNVLLSKVIHLPALPVIG